jgi:epoxyqueuosine reductase
MFNSQAERQNIRTRFPWAASVLVLGTPYDAQPRGQLGRDLIAHVARYARSRDYHLIIEKRLKKLAHALTQAGVCSRAHWHVDTGPILERAWAEAAGVGWIGKNACAIHPHLGSFMLLAEIVMDSAPEPGAPIANRCGTCRRCLDACPTGALIAPGVLDARRCLATWNIERRGAAPSELWHAQREWVFGCDTCQSVCPHNKPRPALAQKGTSDAELAAPRPWHTMTLAECIALAKADFERAFTASPLRRATLKGLRLSAITVAGNLRAESCRMVLESCRTDEDADIRLRAEWALARE